MLFGIYAFCIYTVNTILTFKSCARHEFRGNIMKKLLLLFALTLPLLLSAKPVDSVTAQKVAQTFLKVSKAQLKNQTIHPVSAPKFAKQATQQITPEQQFYVYQNPDGGYVIISADDVAHPILGYSHTGQLDLDNMPDNLRWWLSEYDRQIRWAQENNVVQSEEVAREWQKALTQTLDATVMVEPLVTTHWGQSYPYNELCPSNADGKALTGCVATAMAQIMRYWRWPEQGLGSHKYTPNGYSEQSADFGSTTYNWSKMPAYYDGSSWYADEREAVATLMWHCGISVNMAYGKDFSGAYPWDQDQALKKYFRYDHKAEYVHRADYSRENWLFLIEDQLNNHQPVLYGGEDGSGNGHAFLCDGYNSADFLHFNWGWNGNEDNYFSIDAMVLGYNNNQDAVIHIIPEKPQTEDHVALTATLPSNWGTTITAWVWTNKTDGHFENLAVNDRKVTFESDNKPLNIIFINGTTWNGDNNQTEDIIIDRNTCINIDENTEGKRKFFIKQCPHEITLTVYPPADWGTEISAWMWTNTTDGHWVNIEPENGEYKVSVEGEKLNAVVVKGWNHKTDWSDISNQNDQTVDISITNDAYVQIGSEASGKRAFAFKDMPSHLITVRAKKPADWGANVSAYYWENGQSGKWVTPTRQGDWFTYERFTSRLNIIFVNGDVSDWSQVGGDNNQTVDITTQQDACYILGNNGGKKSAILTDCSEAPDKPTDIDNVVQPANARTHKLIHQGQLLLLHNGEIYNAQGARVE